MTRNADVARELVWEHAVRDVPARDLSAAREAAPDELCAIAGALDLLACKSLTAAYSIVPTANGRYHLSGSLRAQVVQACVVTLDPVDSSIAESFDATFWPEEEMPEPPSGALDLDEEPDPEPIVAGQIAVGRVVFECLAAAIDPFPRKPDAVLDRNSAAATEGDVGKAESPFAVLANIKPKA